MTTFIYEKKDLELKDVRQMLQNNELMKKTYYIEEASKMIVKGRGGDHRVEDLRRVPKLLAKIMIATTANS